MKDENIEALAQNADKSHAKNFKREYTPVSFYEDFNDGFKVGYKAASKEEVSWDEAFDEYAKSDSKTIFTRWAESKFNLVRKTREEISVEENANEAAAERHYERLMEGGDTPTKEQMMAWQKLK